MPASLALWCTDAWVYIAKITLFGLSISPMITSYHTFPNDWIPLPLTKAANSRYRTVHRIGCHPKAGGEDATLGIHSGVDWERTGKKYADRVVEAGWCAR